MLNSSIYSAIISRRVQDSYENRYLYLFENILIVNKKPGLFQVDRRFDLTSLGCQIQWKYENNVLKEMMIYDAQQKQRVVYTATPEILVELQGHLNGRAFYRNFHHFYQKLEVIRSHKNVEILLCKNIKTQDVYVTKVVKFINNKLDETDQNSLVENEAKIFQKLSYYPHPQVLVADQIFVQDSCLIYIMNYCKGGTLVEYLCEHELTLPDQVIKEIMKQLLSGLDHLHKLGVMHRDLKLDNIMLMKKNDHRSIKIIDFGFSTFFDPFTVHVQRCGTPGYIAPEILKMELYNELCDIYSLGCIFHALLTGRRINQTPKSTKASDLVALSKNIKISLSQICGIEALDLLESMISQLNKRPDAQACLRHAYFEEDYFIIEEFETKLVKLEFPVFRNPFLS